MPSRSLEHWSSIRQTALDEIEAAHLSVGGVERGRRYATTQINHAYAMLLSSQFQGFCRDLHSECAEHFVLQVPSGLLRDSLYGAILAGRKLNIGNPSPGNIGADYNRFGLPFWDSVQACGDQHRRNLDHLEDLNRWRNAIAHQDFDAQKLGGAGLRLAKVRIWRKACMRLATTFDRVMREQLFLANGQFPW